MTAFWEVWGVVAGLVTSSGYIPQIIKGYRTKKLEDLSYLLNALMGLGMLMWLVYGIAIRSLAVTAANILGVSLNITLLAMKYHYSRK
ncbi:MAG: SemiSWEET family transporter [Candidatus Woesearchaeota archaeon]